MSKSLFTEVQIRQIIEKTSQIAQSNNGVVPISSIDDAASFAAYIAGFSSWKKYRKAIKKESETELVSELPIVERQKFSFLNIDISPSRILEFKEILKSLPKKGQSIELRENRQLVFKVAVGQNYNKLTKATQACFLNLENTCFIGSNTKFIDYVKDNLQQQLQTVIEINSSNKSTLKLDPINEIFSGDYLEDFLSKNTKDHKDFSFFWGLLIKQLFQQYKMKLNADFLMETLELDFILKAWCLLSQESNFLSSILMTYIKSLPSLRIESSKINISQDAQEKHWENIMPIYKQLLTIKNAYDEGIFEYGGISILDCMREKKSVDISIPVKTKRFIGGLINFLIVSASKAYQKEVEGLDIKEQAVFLINKNSNVMSTPVNTDYIFCLMQIPPYESYKLQHFEQIVFSTHLSFLEPELEFIRNFYLNTQKIEENIFSNSGSALLCLPENHAYLWQKENKEAHYDSFVLVKINN